MSASRTPSGRSRVPILVTIAVVAVVTLAAAGAVYMFGGSAPAAVSLATVDPGALSPVTPASGSPSANASSASSSAAASSAASSGQAPGGTSGSVDGTWNVDTSIGSFSDFTASFVGYRVAENLANVGSTTAVGRSPKVSGSLTLQGATVTAATFTADLTALQSDKPMRDGQLTRQALETNQFPNGTFELTTPIQLPTKPADGATWTVTAQGKLTIHGVSKAVSIPLQAKLSGGVATVVGSLEIAFADYGMTPPQSMVVLSVADHGTLELQLLFRHA